MLVNGYFWHTLKGEADANLIEVGMGSNFNEHQLLRLLVVNPFNGLDENIAERAIALLNQ